MDRHIRILQLNVKMINKLIMYENNMKQYFIVDKETKHMVGNTVYGSAKMADMDIEKIEGDFKKYEVYAFDMNCLNKDLIFYAMTNDNPCVYKQRTR